jgi:hypothetical protein
MRFPVAPRTTPERSAEEGPLPRRLAPWCHSWSIPREPLPPQSGRGHTTGAISGLLARDSGTVKWAGATAGPDRTRTLVLLPPAEKGQRLRLSDDADALADRPTKKACKSRAFTKRLMGFEPTTFCMASSSLDSERALNVPANRPVSAARVGAADARFSPRNHGSFRTETGLALIPRQRSHATSAGSSWQAVTSAPPPSACAMPA